MFLIAPAWATSILPSPQTSIIGDQVTVWWRTDVSASTEVHYGPASAGSSAGYQFHSVFAATAGTVHSRTLSTGLAPGAYFYRVRSTDGVSAAESSEMAFVIPRPAAHTPLFTTGFNGRVDTIAQAGTIYYLGGSFSQAGIAVGGGVALDATSGAALPDQPRVAGSIGKVIVDGRGGYFVAGTFSSIGGLYRANIAHILPDTGVDPLFDASLEENSAVDALTLLNGTLYVSGNFRSANGEPRSIVAAFDATNGALRSWAPDVSAYVLSLQGDGDTIYMAGTFQAVNGSARRYAAAVDAQNGALTGWNPNPGNWVYNLEPWGATMLLGGFFTSIQGAPRWLVAQVELNGAPTGWTGPFSSLMFGVVYRTQLSASTIYLAGSVGRTAVGPKGLVEIDQATGAFTSWDPAPDGIPRDIFLAKQTLYVAGDFSRIASESRDGLAAFDTTTNALLNWAPSFSGAQAVASTGSTVYVGGQLLNAGQRRSNLAAFDSATGTLTPWAPVTDRPVSGLLVQGPVIYAVGSFATANGVSRRSAAAFDATTGALLPWDPSIGMSLNSLRSVVLSPAGDSVVVSGWFEQINITLSRPSVALVDPVSGTDIGFVPALNPSGSIFSVNAAASNDSVLYLGGQFKSAIDGGISRINLAALNASGEVTPWQPLVDSPVQAMIKIGAAMYLGGQFRSVNGVRRAGLAAVDLDAGALRPGDLAPFVAVQALAQAATNVIVAGVEMRADGGFGTSAVRGFDALTGQPSSFRIVTGGGSVSALNVDCSRNQIAIVGLFATIDGHAQPGFSILSADLACRLVDAGVVDASVVDAGIADAAIDGGFQADGGIQAVSDSGASLGDASGSDFDDGGVDSRLVEPRVLQVQCGCQSGGGTNVLWLWLAGLGLLALRRRTICVSKRS